MSSIPSRENFIFADFETPRCQFCTKLPEMSDLCYLRKTRRMILIIWPICSEMMMVQLGALGIMKLGVEIIMMVMKITKPIPRLVLPQCCRKFQNMYS